MTTVFEIPEEAQLGCFSPADQHPISVEELFSHSAAEEVSVLF